MPRRNRPQSKHGTPGRNLSARARGERDARKRLEQAEDRPARVKREPGPVICPSGKHGYPEHVARRKLEQFQAQQNANHPKPTGVYPCRLCKYWHLTSAGPPARPVTAPPVAGAFDARRPPRLLPPGGG